MFCVKLNGRLIFMNLNVMSVSFIVIGTVNLIRKRKYIQRKCFQRSIGYVRSSTGGNTWIGIHKEVG